MLFYSYVTTIVEKLRRLLAQESRIEGKTTGSFGVSKATNNTDCKTLLRQADKCLYYAKEHGKTYISLKIHEKLCNNLTCDGFEFII